MNGMTSAVRMALVGAFAAATIGLAAGEARASSSESLAGTEYVQLNSNFPKPVPKPVSSEPYVPFVTDFAKPSHAAGPQVAPSTPSLPTSSTDWSDVGVGGVGAVLVALLAAWGLLVGRRAGLARS